MGNKIARTTQVSASEYYLHDLPSSYNLVLKDVLGSGRFSNQFNVNMVKVLFLLKFTSNVLAFQLLFSVKQSHDNGVCHGDIKCENVLVTSWNWLYLADFASFKPTYIPHDDPSDFSFFFDTGGRRRCYLAPERFYEHGGEGQVTPDAPLSPSMDVFSVGAIP
ncbi:hypothetical protein MKW98_030525 [Papaver atlanticum]|uniref:Protein kinase domain-containing protein n=1 Tax=Papaver atlanticum TaxID=357466 RepID=A0AAD4XSW5_9MAGN|nr:hypothetical protein MKW98_030525 [Papaver atlanticum]